MKGKLVHLELPADDTARARTFWGELCGWKFQSWEGPIEYHMFEGEPGGAIYPAQADERGPIVYFETNDIDKEIARIRQLGGNADDKAPIPGVGWYARCRDTEGNSFSLYENDESVPMPEGAAATTAART
ncbi:MAG: VOC family protein [Thermoleophilia bacterium]|nr:VOC family protein [Thermoleophilia bacterium]